MMNEEVIWDAEWLMSAPVRKLIMHVDNHGCGDEFRFVGGCIRNSLMGIPINDIDIATTLLPEAVVKMFSTDFNVIETGLQHGTVTVVIDHVPFEITTLRKDVETDGRHASVEFVTDWEVDAARRDFTINALYADFDGEVYDYNGGIEDIQAGVVRFIGDPRKRIEEDYLRIMRLFRFQAWYGKTDMHTASKAWATLLKDGLQGISQERITAELLKLLAAPNTTKMTSAIRDMHNAGILQDIIPSYQGPDKLYKLARVDNDPILLLSTLIPNWAPRVRDIGNEMRLSREQTTRMANAVLNVDNAVINTVKSSIEAAVYNNGLQTYEDIVKKRWSRTDFDVAELEDILTIARDFAAKNVKLPVTGDDLIKAGMKPGPELGKRLREIEAFWVREEFVPDRETLLRIYT